MMKFLKFEIIIMMMKNYQYFLKNLNMVYKKINLFNYKFTFKYLKIKSDK